jgi:Holliday junction resolvase
MAATTPENKVKAQVKSFLKRKGFYHFSAVAGPFAVHGIPDIIVCAGGRFVGIECKAPGKEKNTTPNQQRHLKLITSAGGVAFVASSVFEVEQAFKELGLVDP